MNDIYFTVELIWHAHSSVSHPPLITSCSLNTQQSCKTYSLSITVGARCCEITFSPNQRIRDRRADGAMGYGFALRFQCTSACQQRDVAMDSFKQIGYFIALVHTLSLSRCLG
jgi:hypothetical protein